MGFPQGTDSPGSQDFSRRQSAHRDRL